MKLEQVADTVKEGIDYHIGDMVDYHVFCGPGHPASDEMIISQLANHFTTRELKLMLTCVSYGENDPNQLRRMISFALIVAKLLGLTSITKELIQAAIVERQGCVYTDWSGDSYMGDNW
jgi:hypothetical protein